jgi:hypothetical protein
MSLFDIYIQQKNNIKEALSRWRAQKDTYGQHIVWTLADTNIRSPATPTTMRRCHIVDKVLYQSLVLPVALRTGRSSYRSLFVPVALRTGRSLSQSRFVPVAFRYYAASMVSNEAYGARYTMCGGWRVASGEWRASCSVWRVREGARASVQRVQFVSRMLSHGCCLTDGREGPDREALPRLAVAETAYAVGPQCTCDVANTTVGTKPN